jgi:hypothetical protein
MPGLLDFVTMKFQPRSVVSKSAAYTLLVTDEQVILTGSSAVTFTLPAMDSIAQQVVENKLFLLTNNSTAILTINPGTNGVTGAAQTIGGRSSLALNPNEQVVVYSQLNKTDWQIQQWPIPAERRNLVPLVALTNGTVGVNLVDASGAGLAGTIVGILAIAQDTNAGNITVTNGTNTVATIAKSTTAGVPVGDAGLSNANVAAGAVLTAQSSTTNGNAKVIVFFSAQTLA